MNVRRLAGAAATLALAVLVTTGPAGPAVAAGASAPEFTAVKTVTRTNLDASGQTQTVSSKTVHVSVSKTTGLRGRQDINVSWSGAAPTGGVQPDLNGVLADQQEYPMVILECRGQDTTAVPAAQQVAPTSCWTHGSDARYQGVYYTAFAPWRVDRYASIPDRAQVVGRPASVPAACGSQPTTERWVPFIGVTGARYDYGNQSCAGLPPEDYNYDTSAQVVPPNATFAPTAVDGTGTVKFDVWTGAENASLGCSATVACTLEIIPIMGISCDLYGKAGGVPAEDVPGPSQLSLATRLCQATGTYTPGSLSNPSQSADLAVSGALWWAASNWRNRISVPLSFAPISSACSQIGGGAPVSVYGSELLNEATAQWAPTFCLDPKLFKFTHVQTAEPLAQTLLNTAGSQVNAAFASLPPPTPFGRPTVQAPVAATGFAISYNIDGRDRRAVTNLRMTPRLLAKLLTESYPGDNFDRFAPGQFGNRNPNGTAGSGIHDNPVNITDDPEFQALNPGITALNGLPGPATLLVLSAQSDVTYALTSYINSDPEARAWLDGKPDPWGMKVNNYYVGITLPVLRWPLLDTTLPDFGDAFPCTKVDPAPWLPLLASPTPTLVTSTLDVQFASSPGRNACVLSGDPSNPSNQLYQWTGAGRQQPGLRFIIGVTSLGEAARYDLQTAALQTSSSVDPGAQYTGSTGRTFVSASPASLAAAAKHLVQDDADKVWQVSSDALRADPGAYPGFMLVNADVPTTGLTKELANDYANLLTFAAGPGQTPGLGNGLLPPGYLPLSAASGLGALASYTARAAEAVRTQSGQVPPLIAPPTPPGGGTHGGGGHSTGPGGTGPGGNPSGGGTPSGGSTPSGRSGPPTKAAPSSSLPAQQPVAQTFRTPKTGFGVGGWILPALLGVGLLSGLVAAGATYRPGRRR